jgi:hypothetical protein
MRESQERPRLAGVDFEEKVRAIPLAVGTGAPAGAGRRFVCGEL